MEAHAILVLTTVPSIETGQLIANKLLELKLAACINMVPAINSLYTWKGEICKDEEILLMIKSKSTLFSEELVPALKNNHPYDVPEIIALPVISGDKDYLDWIDDVTK